MLFESVPNFSERRDQQKINRITAAVQSVPNVRVLDLHSDPDHNRSVLTFVGEEVPLVETAAALATACTEEIDLSTQTGVHPRIGVLDVLPFIPLEGATMDDAIHLARQAGGKLGELGFSVYLYEHAATAPHRRNLAELRRGGYAGLVSRIKEPAWRPDYGLAHLDPRRGAIAVGARNFLVAFNAYLDTADVEVARAVAKRIRERDGGLPGLKALGLLVGGRAQVSMNLTDLEKTSLPVALEAVREAASGYGSKVEWMELVGMMPLEALLQTARHHLSLREFGRKNVLEQGLWDESPDPGSTKGDSE